MGSVLSREMCFASSSPALGSRGWSGSELSLGKRSRGKDVPAVEVDLFSVVESGEAMPLPASALTKVVQSSSVYPRQVPESTCREWLQLWAAHLESLGWWGDLSATHELVDSYSEAYPTVPNETPIDVPASARANTEASFRLLVSASGAPWVLAIARSYLLHTGLQPNGYSVSALPATGATHESRRAFTISVGVTEVLFVVLDMFTGEIIQWDARVPREYVTHLERWRDLEFPIVTHGAYAQGTDPRSLLRLLSNQEDSRALRAGVDELVEANKAHRRDDWHNPYLDDALMNPAFVIRAKPWASI